jgi:hypothetical protein
MQSFYSKEEGATYNYEASLTGRHEIALRWTYYSTRCAEVPIEIYDGDALVDVVIVDQTQDSAQWNVLGTYDFVEGSAKVVVVSDTGNCSTCADAAAFSLIESDPETEDDPGPEPDQQPNAIDNPIPEVGSDTGHNNLSEYGSGGGCFINLLR